nr:unnamed protein product [Callosobruchus chinensis]
MEYARKVYKGTVFAIEQQEFISDTESEDNIPLGKLISAGNLEKTKPGLENKAMYSDSDDDIPLARLFYQKTKMENNEQSVRGYYG